MMELSSSPMDPRNINYTKIYRLLYDAKDGLSKQDIVRQLQLSLPTVTQKLGELQAEGLVRDSGSVGNAVGRRARTFTIVEDACLAIGVDISRNHVTATAVDLFGNVVATNRERALFERKDGYYRFLGNAVENIIRQAEAEHKKILGVGFGVPGLIGADGQHVFYGKILDFSDATKQEFARYVPYPSRLYNDAKAAGFAELWHRKDITNAFYVLLSHHVGGAMILNHEINLGDHCHAGEIGHLTIVPHGKQCYCGKSGCVDAYCSASVLSDLTNGNLELFFELLRSGDSMASAIWQEYVYCLSLAINNIHMLMDCPVILGGYVGAHLYDHIDQLRETVKWNNSFENSADYLHTCQQKIDMIAVGSALPFISDYLHNI